VSTLQKSIAAQNEAANSKLDTTSGQVQSLNDSVDELKSRIAKLDKSIQELQTQLQNIQNPPAAAPVTSAANGAAPESAPAAASSAAQAPPLKETFQAGVRDLNAAKYEIASSEFRDVIQFYPMDDLAGTAQFYLGEIAYRQQKFSEAIKAYNAMLEGFSGNQKAPAAQLHKGLALLQMGMKQDGINELRILIKRHPQTPEATQARTKLNGMGVKASAAR
jgi:tol-pal system protein YbgF